MHEFGAAGISLAVGAILTALLESLVEKEVLSRDEIDSILDRARSEFASHASIVSVKSAVAVIDSIKSKLA